MQARLNHIESHSSTLTIIGYMYIEFRRWVASFRVVAEKFLDFLLAVFPCAKKNVLILCFTVLNKIDIFCSVMMKTFFIREKKKRNFPLLLFGIHPTSPNFFFSLSFSPPSAPSLFFFSYPRTMHKKAKAPIQRNPT